MSTQQTHERTNKQTNNTQEIWAEKQPDGHVTLRLANHTPHGGYAELASEFIEHLQDLQETLEYGRGPTTVGTATVTETTHETEIKNVEINVNGVV